MIRSKKVAALVASAVVAGGVFATQANANVSGQCTAPGNVAFHVYGFNPAVQHHVEVWMDVGFIGETPKQIVSVNNGVADGTIFAPEGDITVLMRQVGTTMVYRSGTFSCKTPTPVSIAPTPLTPVPSKPKPPRVKPKPPKKVPMTCARFKATHPGAPNGAYRKLGFKPKCGVLPPKAPRPSGPIPVAG